MKKQIQRSLAIAVLILPGFFSTAQAENTFSERIFYVQEDGKQAMVYTTSRSDYKNYSLWFDAKEGYQPEDYLKNFLYLFPNSGEWASDPKPGHMVMKVPQGNFASLEWTDLEENGRLKVDSDGVYYYQNWDSVSKTAEGHFGLWNSPGNFERIAYSWVFPENVAITVAMKSQLSTLILRHNTITYYGTDVNDLTFNIQYRPATGSAYDDLKALEGEGVEVEQEATGVKVTLAETLLFPTGIATISSEGKAVLDKFAETLKQRSSLHVVIAGHADNVPISSGLQARFPTNWELSSIRSINVIHHLVTRGVAENRFESPACSHLKPIASNDTAEGRQKNRRIEVLLTE